MYNFTGNDGRVRASGEFAGDGDAEVTSLLLAALTRDHPEFDHKEAIMIWNKIDIMHKWILDNFGISWRHHVCSNIDKSKLAKGRGPGQPKPSKTQTLP